MFRTLLAAAVLLLSAAVVVSCGGGDRGKTGETDNLAEVEIEEPTPPPAEHLHYHTEHDPDATYTPENVVLEGSYLKVDLESLTPDQFNRVMHRVRTEKSTCGSGLLIDECLVNRPACWVAVTLLEQIIREEKLKS